MVGGFGLLDGETVMFIGQQKGVNTKMRQYRNFGMANPEGYRKALRVMKMAEKFNKPIVCLIDTPGAYPGLCQVPRWNGLEPISVVSFVARTSRASSCATIQADNHLSEPSRHLGAAQP